MLEASLVGLALALIGTTVLWLVSLARRDASIADTFWGLGFVLLAALYGGRTDGWPVREGIVLALTAVWGLRLSLHIHGRNRGRGEDRRYARWRDEAGSSYWWKSLPTVFLLQALILWIVSAPLLAAQAGATPTRLTAWDGAGVLLWGIGFAFEAISDWQLTAFRRDPANAGKVLQTGLWRYSRHPNYFGDALVWWGLWAIAAGVPGGGWTVVSPVLMTFLLARVSGVTLLERDLREAKPGYRNYMTRTSAFFPLPPRRDPAGDD